MPDSPDSIFDWIAIVLFGSMILLALLVPAGAFLWEVIMKITEPKRETRERHSSAIKEVVKREDEDDDGDPAFRKYSPMHTVSDMLADVQRDKIDSLGFAHASQKKLDEHVKETFNKILVGGSTPSGRTFEEDHLLDRINALTDQCNSLKEERYELAKELASVAYDRDMYKAFLNERTEMLVRSGVMKGARIDEFEMRREWAYRGGQTPEA